MIFRYERVFIGIIAIRFYQVMKFQSFFCIHCNPKLGAAMFRRSCLTISVVFLLLIVCVVTGTCFQSPLLLDVSYVNEPIIISVIRPRLEVQKEKIVYEVSSPSVVIYIL